VLKIVEKGTGKRIPYAKTSIYNQLSTVNQTYTTDSLGTIRIHVERFSSYFATGSKKGYVDGNAKFATTDQDNKIIELQLELPPIKRGDIFTLENIFYDYNKASLRPESTASLDKLVAFILENNVKIELSSHTDSRGTDSYNLKLSQARAQSCVDYLLRKGVPKANIVAKGYGEIHLLNRCKNGVVCSEEEHQINRRTEIKIL
jgi:outer membrane protein OmpA-like peptidoglycan-associated protein